MLRFNCRIGHGWSVESLIAYQSESTEAALWTAVRVLEERAALCERIRQRADEAGHRLTASHFEDRGDEASRAATLIRRLVMNGETRASNEPWSCRELRKKVRMAADEFDNEFETLLRFLKRARGFDFTGYKRPSLIRRAQRRMQALCIQSYEDYLDFWS
jgi:hypothetical protein